MVLPRPAILIVTLLFASPLTGCLGEEESGPRLATPTDKPPTVPDRTPPPPPKRGIEDPDFTDPGFRFNATWREGDGWDWDSNDSRWRSVRVVEVANVSNRTLVRVDQVDGEYRGAAPIRSMMWFDASDWTRINSSAAGKVTTFTPPPADARLYRNATMFWNQTLEGARTAVAVNSWYSGFDSVGLPWGTFRVGHVEHRVTAVGPEGASRALIVREPSNVIGNDARFSVNGEVYLITGAKFGNLTLGSLRTV